MKLICNALLFVILISSNAQTALCATDANEKSQKFEFVTMDGGKIGSENLKGKIIVLDFRNIHCGGCRKSMPEIEAAKKFAESKSIYGWNDSYPHFFKKILIKKPHKQRYNVTSCISDGYGRLLGGFGTVNKKNLKKLKFSS